MVMALCVFVCVSVSECVCVLGVGMGLDRSTEGALADEPKLVRPVKVSVLCVRQSFLFVTLCCAH